MRVSRRSIGMVAMAPPPPPPHHHGSNASVHQRPFAEHSYPAVTTASSHGTTASMPLLLAFGIAGGIACIVVLGLSVLIVYTRFKASRTSPFDPGNADPVRLQKFSYRELKSATGGFSNEAKLGQGGFGPVYKGVLRSGLVVAVKSLDSASLQGEREFQNELCVIGGVRAPHIVGLLGFCSERKRRLLVYEFMARRSLQEALFDEEYPASLDWKMRFSIILDIAQALAFLHFRCEPPIIHGDLKPSNVLLDENFSAKIADFGLARVKTEVAAGSEIRSEDVDRESSLDLRDHKRLERWQQRKKRRFSEGGNQGSSAMNTKDEVQVVQEDAGEVTLVVHGDQGDTTKLARQSSGSAFSFHHCECPGSDTMVDSGCWKIESKRVDEADVTFWSPPDVDHHSVDVDVAVDVGDHGNHLALDVEEERPVSPTMESGEGDKPWWRKQGDGDTVVKDYTVDWLACEVKSGRSRSRDWTDTVAGGATTSKHQLRDWLKTSESEPAAACCFGSFKKNDGRLRAKRRRQSRTELSGTLTKSREWWKEEYVEELSNKSRELKGERCKKHGARSRDMSWSFDFSGDLNRPGGGREWWSGDLLHWIHRSRGDSGTIDFSGDLNGPKDRTWSRDRWSGELTSRAMSSTTSMRGTVCYVAPEYGGGGLLSEKSDVYSFGVLMLVIISGRRPLQVVSPSVEFERANLTTWARHLAHNGDVLDLVDASLRGEFVKEQARDCIMLALQCLQRIPAVRPSMAEVVRILSGETQLSVSLPDLFSPSPPPGSSPRSWKQQSEQAGEHPLLLSE